MHYILETERLRLRQLELTDAQFIVELVNTPGWLRFIGDRNIKTNEDAIRYLQNGPLKSYKENGFGLLLVELKSDQISIGTCGILKRDSLENPDIGFAFLPEFTGKGYAFEVAHATLTYAKDELKLETIYAITIPSNIKSIQLLKKMGLGFVKTIYDPKDNSELLLYSN
ncbi:MAG: GNAT family N-acetyltransferase [Chryseolinea sp.]